MYERNVFGLLSGSPCRFVGIAPQPDRAGKGRRSKKAVFLSYAEIEWVIRNEQGELEEHMDRGTWEMHQE